MSSPLDKFKKKTETAPAATVPATSEAPKKSLLTDSLARLSASTQSAATPAATAPAAKPSAVSGALGNLLANVKGTAVKQQTTTEANLQKTYQAAAAAKAQAEASQLATAATEVPADIYTLDPAITRIDGLNADAFSATLARTYQSLVNDQPDLGSLLEAINKNLRQYEELSYLLTPAQLGLIVDGILKTTNTIIKTTAPKKTSAQLDQQVRKEGGLDLDSM